MNMSLYAPNQKREPIKGTGFANKDIAIKTLDIIKNLSDNHQVWIVTTMYNRAKYHPHRTKSMLSAMKVFHKWLKNRLIKKATKYKFAKKNFIKNILQDPKIKLSSKQRVILQQYINGEKISLELLLYRHDYIKHNIDNPMKLLKLGYITTL